MEGSDSKLLVLNFEGSFDKFFNHLSLQPLYGICQGEGLQTTGIPFVFPV